MSYREDLDAYLEACCREDRKDRRDDLRAEQQRLKELMNDLLITFSETHNLIKKFICHNVAP